MAQNITLLGANYSAVPAVTLPKTGGGTAQFDDTTDADATAADIVQGKTAYVNGVKLTGTGTGGGGGSVTQDQDGYIVLPSTGGGGGGGATQHTIHLEFSDSTDTDISVYYDDSVLGTMITAYQPSTWTYSTKTVEIAELDGVEFYNINTIPIGVELIDFTAITEDYVIDSSGQVVAEQWYAVSDYTPIESGMTFSFTGCRWFYAAYYDSTKTYISSFPIYNYTTESPYNSNCGDGTLSSSIPANAAYIRISSISNPSSLYLSLIRTA